MECEHGLSIKENSIGEMICYCELWAEWRNITLGDCIGNCESEEKEGEKMNKKEAIEILKKNKPTSDPRRFCQAKRTGQVKYRGKPTIEFYKDGKPQYYCYGYRNVMTEEFLEVCKNCADFVDRAEEDLKGLRNVSMNDI